MQPFPLPPEEIARLRVRTVIEKDDPEALCNEEGWIRFQALLGEVRSDNYEDTHVTRWLIVPLVTELGSENVFAERWVDARDFARRRFGVEPNRVVKSHDLGDEELGAVWAVRWVGSAMTPNDPPRLEYIQIMPEKTRWRDVRDLEPAKKRPAK